MTVGAARRVAATVGTAEAGPRPGPLPGAAGAGPSPRPRRQKRAQPPRLGRAARGRDAPGGPDRHALGGVAVSMRSARSATPALMAESATLKAGQCHPPQ